MGDARKDDPNEPPDDVLYPHHSEDDNLVIGVRLPPEAKVNLADQSVLQMESASAMVVVTNAIEYQKAAAFLIEIDTAAKAIEETRKDFTRPLDELKKQWMDRFRPHIERLVDAKATVARAMQTWRSEQERMARAEQDRLRKEAEEKRKSEIDAALDKKDLAAARDIASAPVIAPTIIPTIPTVKGVTTRTDWRFEVIDPSLVPREYLMIDEKALQAVATSRKNTAQVSGVRFFPVEAIVRTRG